MRRARGGYDDRNAGTSAGPRGLYILADGLGRAAQIEPEKMCQRRLGPTTFYSKKRPDGTRYLVPKQSGAPCPEVAVKSRTKDGKVERRCAAHKFGLFDD